MTTSGTLTDLLGAARIYPVHLILPERSGFTLWGGNVDGEIDYFLTNAGGTVLLAGSLPELTSRVAQDGAGPLTGVDGFTAIRDALAHGQRFPDDSAEILDFAQAGNDLRSEEELPGDVAARLVACLDAARDLARQVPNPDMMNRLQASGEPLRMLYDVINGEAATVDRADAAAAFDGLRSWIVANVR
ncbi:hypothetical protein [Actinoplanes siamensis]|uniref:hypothetical protein n=1 Tax=Actinoplanes siamensis TaxID=1223317 RepID=UPI0019452049|nr:hypothetical protein [Actinoplanes siamensis]